MSNSEKHTIPTDCNYDTRNIRSAKQRYKQIDFAVRECIANAVSYNGKNVYVRTARVRDKNKLLICSDADPFKDGQEILSVGVTPNKTTGNKMSYQGNGVIRSATSLDRNSVVVVGSFCGVNRKFYAGEGRANLKLNQWSSSDVSGQMEKDLREIFGDDTWRKQYNVFTMFDLGGYGDENVRLSAKKMNFITHLDKELCGKINVTFGEQQIGCSVYYDGKNGKKLEGKKLVEAVEKYKNLKNAKGETNGGSERRKIIGEKEFDLRYKIAGCTVKIEQPIEIELGNNPLIKMVIEEAEVELTLNPGHRKNPGEKKKGWMVMSNEHLKSEGLGFTCNKGGMMSFGTKPPSTTFLTCPDSISLVDKPRFGHNVFMAHNNSSSLMTDYWRGPSLEGKDSDPFVLMRFSTGIIRSITTEDGTVYPEEDAFNVFMGILGRTSDWWLNSDRANGYTRRIMEAIAENTDLPAEFMKLLRETFPSVESDRVPIFLKEGQMGKKRPDPSTVKIYDLDNKEGGYGYDRHLSLGQIRTVAFRDIVRNRWISKSEISSYVGTRGVEYTDDLASLHSEALAELTNRHKEQTNEE